MGRPNIDGPLSFGVNPRLSAAATRKREFVHAVAIHDCKAQVTVGRHTFDGTDQVPHPPLLNRAEYSTLIWLNIRRGWGDGLWNALHALLGVRTLSTIACYLRP
jgi:hypothetical protein